jgi:phage/plasmid-like protein (TIGR03299 family)
MAHMIDTSNGRENFAFTGNRNAIWHRLGNELQEGASIEEWSHAAGMDWEVYETNVRFIDSDGQDRVYPKKKVLYRSDNLKELSIVGKDFKVVPPREVLEFFRDLTEEYGMKLSTAGCLYEGQKFWALADTGKFAEVKKGDHIKGHLLFVTSVDGTISSMAKFTSIRVVCNNTLSISLNEKSNNIVRKTHRSVWDNKEAKINLGILDESWETFMSDLRKLSDRKMSDNEVQNFFEKTFYNPERDDEKQGWGAVKKISSLMNLYHNGEGANMAYGTAYGALNAITNLFTHGNENSRKKQDNIFWSGFVGNDNIKNNAMNELLEMC